MRNYKDFKILVLVESIDRDDSSGSKGRVALIENLHEIGYELKVYHYTRKNIDLVNIDCSAIQERKFNLLFLLSRVQRKLQKKFRVNLAKRLEPLFGFSFTFLNDVNSMKKALKKEKEFRPNLVLTLSKGASYRSHYTLLKIPELHTKWMAYIHDPYPFHFYPEPYKWSEPGYKQKIDFFREVSEKCRWAGFPSLLLAEWMENKFGSFTGKRVVIPHQLRQEEGENKLPNFFKPEKFNLLHAGNLMKQRSPFGLIQGFLKFLERNPNNKGNCQLLLVGNASYHEKELKDYQKREKNVFISKGYIPYREVLYMQKKASVNIILEAKAEISPFLPGKFPHCIISEKPILYLGPERSEVRRLMGKGYPFCSEVDDADKIADLIAQLYEKWKLDKGKIRLNRKDLKAYLSHETLKNELDKILSDT